MFEQLFFFFFSLMLLLSIVLKYFFICLPTFNVLKGAFNKTHYFDYFFLPQNGQMFDCIISSLNKNSKASEGDSIFC